MRRIDLLLVGDAKDGPNEEAIRIVSVESATRMFGGYDFERITMASGSTGHTLSSTPWGGDVFPLQADSDGFLIPKRLYEFSVSGSILTWTKPGEQSVVYFRTLTLPGSTNLLKGIFSTRRTGLTVHALRLGGDLAVAGPSGGFTFRAVYNGSRYNGSTITITGSNAIVRPSAGTGRDMLYTISSDTELIRLLRDEVAKGYQSITLVGPGSSTSITIPSGFYTLTGGDDGTLTADMFKTYLEEHDLDGVDVICPVGLTTEELSGAGVYTILETNPYPTLLVAQAPATGDTLLTTQNINRYVVSVGFKILYEAGSLKRRLDDAAPLVAATIANTIFESTLAKLVESPAEPKYTQTQLHTAVASGHTLAYRSISKDWALWYAVTGDSDWPVSTFRAYQEIVRAVYEVLEPTIGNIVLDEVDLENLLDEAFRQVTGSTIIDWRLELDRDVIYADVDFQPYGEVRVIEAKIALGTQRALSPV